MVPNIDIRAAVLKNIETSNDQEIAAIIEDSISKNEEITLPGLGVLFEVFWKAADDNMKSQITNLIVANK